MPRGWQPDDGTEGSVGLLEGQGPVGSLPFMPGPGLSYEQATGRPLQEQQEIGSYSAPLPRPLPATDHPLLR